MNFKTKEVIKKNMSTMWKIVLVLSISAGTILYGILLKFMGDAMPYIDAFTTITSIAAMIVSVKMFAEQWWIWIVVDIVTVYMWFVSFMNENDNIATLIMWMVYLVNAVIMLVKWEKEARIESVKASTHK